MSAQAPARAILRLLPLNQPGQDGRCFVGPTERKDERKRLPDRRFPRCSNSRLVLSRLDGKRILKQVAIPGIQTRVSTEKRLLGSEIVTVKVTRRVRVYRQTIVNGSKRATERRRRWCKFGLDLQTEQQGSFVTDKNNSIDLCELLPGLGRDEIEKRSKQKQKLAAAMAAAIARKNKLNDNLNLNLNLNLTLDLDNGQATVEQVGKEEK